MNGVSSSTVILYQGLGFRSTIKIQLKFTLTVSWYWLGIADPKMYSDQS